MFVIVYNNQVVLGPMKWNKYRFENFLEEEHEVTASLPSSNESEVITVNSECKIYPVQGTPDPTYNPVIEFLHGPFWTFTDTAAVSSYVAEPLPIEAVKNMLKARTAAERYKRETAGTTVSIQGTDVGVSTSRDSRVTFNQAYLLANDSSITQWKFNDVWLSLSKTDLEAIVTAISTHVQTQFDWEAAKVSEIDACTASEQLAAIEIEPKEVLNLLG